MTLTICEASVVVKWFHSEAETEVREARAVLAAHQRDRIQAMVLDLTYYEIGNFMARRARWTGDRIAARLGDLAVIVGSPIRPAAPELATAASLAADHELSFYDATYWAVALSLDAALVTSDDELLEAGAGESPTAFSERLRLDAS